MNVIGPAPLCRTISCVTYSLMPSPGLEPEPRAQSPPPKARRPKPWKQTLKYVVRVPESADAKSSVYLSNGLFNLSYAFLEIY